VTEQELRRTAVIIPPTGRAVLCVWAAVPGLFAAPFVFWQSIVAGAGFCLLWGFLVYCLWARACSFAAVQRSFVVVIVSPFSTKQSRQTAMISLLLSVFLSSFKR